MEKKQIIDTIAENLRTLINQAEFSSAELARRCRISTGTISKILSGSMSMTIPMAINLANGLEVDLSELLRDLIGKKSSQLTSKKIESPEIERLFIGVLSISNKRITCIKDYFGNIVGRSELNGGLDLAETTGNLMSAIRESIDAALAHTARQSSDLKHAKLNIVTKSYEFAESRRKFTNIAKKYFRDVLLLSDWQITYFAAFDKNRPGISLIVDKGVSLSYMAGSKLSKLGGWKFPVYDLGGENWLGLETIRHTIDAVEGYIPMSELSSSVMAKLNGKIETLTEACFKGKNLDIYCSFSDRLLRSYLTGDIAAKTIVEQGFKLIHRSIEKVDTILGKQLKITINGSLVDIYQVFFDTSRLTPSPSNAEKAELLVDITPEFLAEYGVAVDQT